MNEYKDIKQQLQNVTNTMTGMIERVVVPARDPKVNESMVLMYSPDGDYYVALRTQECNTKQAIKRLKRVHGTTFEEVFSILSYQNPHNLWHQFKDQMRREETKGTIKFHRTTFRTTLDSEMIKTVFMTLEKNYRNGVKAT